MSFPFWSRLCGTISSDAFLAAFRRFVARRGKCANIFSDNGTNFVGASRKLDEDFRKAIQDNVQVAPVLEKEHIHWHFIPPAGPHFGGIWEAGVKSVKYHLKRVIGDSNLTYEEMATWLCQIEAGWNSRPLYTTGEYVHRSEGLTSGQFLIRRPMLEAAETRCGARMGNRERWKLLQ